MTGYNVRYKPFIDDKNSISPNKIKKNSFYLIKEYVYTDGDKSRYTDVNAPIIYTLFVSKAKDIIHCVKVSNVRPDIIKKFFGKIVDEDREKIKPKIKTPQLYESIIKKIPSITSNAYRTYKLSGIKKILELNMDISKITPPNRKPPVKEKIEPKGKK